MFPRENDGEAVDDFSRGGLTGKLRLSKTEARYGILAPKLPILVANDARLLPQLADTGELVAYARTLPGLFVSVLVPNLRGAESALASGADLMLVPLSASHAHSLANLRKTPDEVVAEVARMRAARDAAGSTMLIEGGIGTAFGCTLQGRVEPAEVLRCMQALLDAERLDWPGRQVLPDAAAPVAGEDVWEDLRRLIADRRGALRQGGHRRADGAQAHARRQNSSPPAPRDGAWRLTRIHNCPSPESFLRERIRYTIY